MDSLLSNAQRCARKAESLCVYGLYDEALNQLDKSIAFLNELKSLTTRYDNVQMLNVQIDSIDRNKRSVAIKRSESIKKKNRIETILQNRKLNSSNNIQRNSNHYDHAPVLIEYCTASVDKCVENNYFYSSDLPEQSTMIVQGSKLDKDEKSIIEELSTTNAEFKKVNSFLVDEIEQLKKENDFLKVELIKLHMNDSLTSDSSISEHHDLNSTASNQNNENSYISTSSGLSSCSSARCSPSNNQQAVLQLKCSNINSDDMKNVNSLNESNEYKTPNRLLNNLNKQTSSSTSSASSSSWSISSSSTSLSSQLNKPSQLNKQNSKIIENKSAKIDLSRYINDDDDDDNYDDSFVNKNLEDTDDEFDVNNTSNHMLPPSEFTF